MCQRPAERSPCAQRAVGSAARPRGAGLRTRVAFLPAVEGAVAAGRWGAESPQLEAGARLAGPEEEPSADVRQLSRERAVRARVDVIDERRSGGRAIAPPELATGDWIEGGEEQGPLDGRQVGRIGAVTAGDDVLHQ